MHGQIFTLIFKLILIYNTQDYKRKVRTNSAVYYTSVLKVHKYPVVVNNKSRRRIAGNYNLLH